jgi:hypothetical protein
MMMMERNSTKAIAMYVDSQNSPSVPIQSIPWVEARMNGIWPWGSSGGNFNGWG